MTRWAIFALATLIFSSSANAQSPPDQPTLQCDNGPLHRDYGGTDWLVYSCVDEETLVFVTSAFPFYFLSYMHDGGRRLYGAGNAPREATRPAYEELTRLTPTDFEELLTETKAVSAVLR
ncbi:MAG: hypothetical protein ABW199_07205 [Caulobacterales bacterium]